jgi:membrane-associated phospholipid phosphatase
MSSGATVARSAPLRPRWVSPVSLGALALLFAIAALCDQAGVFRSIDQFAVDHLMAGVTPGPSRSLWPGLYRPFGGDRAWWVLVLDLWLYPCSVLISGLVVAVVAVVMRRRGELAGAWAAAGCWVAGNLAELAGKSALRGPALYATFDGSRFHVRAFDGSFPSGHMIRGIVVVFALALAWPRLRRGLVAWFVPVGPMLVATAAHTPSDVVGGLLMGLLVVGAAGALAAGWSPQVPARRRVVAGG